MKPTTFILQRTGAGTDNILASNRLKATGPGTTRNRHAQSFFPRALRLRIVEAGGDIIRANHGKPHAIRHKGRIDLVTETDLAVEAFLKERLNVLLPEADFLAEESASG